MVPVFPSAPAGVWTLLPLGVDVAWGAPGLTESLTLNLDESTSSLPPVRESTTAGRLTPWPAAEEATGFTDTVPWGMRGGGLGPCRPGRFPRESTGGPWAVWLAPTPGGGI